MRPLGLEFCHADYHIAVFYRNIFTEYLHPIFSTKYGEPACEYMSSFNVLKLPSNASIYKVKFSKWHLILKIFFNIVGSIAAMSIFFI